MFPKCVFCFVLTIACLFPYVSWAGYYQDGVYPGSARIGPFTVKLNVVIYESRIKDIKYIEIPDWGKTEVIKSEMRRRILKKQYLGVDGITGATISCDLIKAAVGDALGQAQALPSPRPTSSPRKSETPTSPRVILQTSQGKIVLRLYPDKAPLAVENFLGLVKKGYYDGTIFHRVIPDFMIQGGDPAGIGRGGESIWGKPFKDEFSPDLKFDQAGLLAMANHGPNTNGSQFFITVAKTPWLNNRHTILGEVISGYEVVEAVSNVPTGPNNRPQEEQKIIKAVVKY